MFPGIGRFSCFLPEVKSLYAGLDLACFIPPHPHRKLDWVELVL